MGGEHTITIRCAVKSQSVNSSGQTQTSTSNYDYVITLNIIDNTEYVTVSFDGEEQVIVSGGTATAPAAPTKEGYTFVGWEDA
ncbi:MAG: InlB B-repeat-containing protein, partial [Clostridia bacterium]|nr:InlB B-repeat-containing protein [Clostridia bacterium]